MITKGNFVTGVQNTAQYTANLRALSFAATIAKLFPQGSSPLYALSSMMAETTAVNTTHSYWTKSMGFPSGVINGAHLAAATTLVLTSNAELLPGSVLLNYTTGEQLLVRTVDAGGTDITVVRAVGTTVAADIAGAEILYVIGNMYEESSLRPQAMAIQPVEVANYTQIIRNTWALSGTAAAVKLIAGDTPVAENRQDAMALHATMIEFSLLFGELWSGTVNGQPSRKLRGIRSDIETYAPANVTTAGATTNYTQFEAALDPCLDVATDARSSNVRTMFCGGQAMRVINGIGIKNGTYQLVQGQTSFGLRFKSFVTTRGQFNLIEHPLLNAFGRTSPFAKMAIAVDLSALRVPYLQGRKTFTKEFNLDGAPVDNGIDAVGGTLTTELTLEDINPAAHAVIYNLTAPAAG